MHVRRLLELGGRIALTAPRYVRQAARMSPTAMHEYWDASRRRIDCWNRALSPFTPSTRGITVSPHDWNETLRPLVEDIIAGELLARIWTATAISHARWHRQVDCEPILRGVLLSHLETRHRALNCITYGTGPETQPLIELQQTRRRVERWTDVLLGEVQRDLDVADWGFEAARVRDFARTATTGAPTSVASPPPTDDEWLEPLRQAFATTLSETILFPHENQQLIVSILNCFHGDWLDALDWSPRDWLHRLHHTSSDVLLWIDDLLKLDAPRVRLPQVDDDE